MNIQEAQITYNKAVEEVDSVDNKGFKEIEGQLHQQLDLLLTVPSYIAEKITVSKSMAKDFAQHLPDAPYKLAIYDLQSVFLPSKFRFNLMVTTNNVSKLIRNFEYIQASDSEYVCNGARITHCFDSPVAQNGIKELPDKEPVAEECDELHPYLESVNTVYRTFESIVKKLKEEGVTIYVDSCDDMLDIIINSTAERYDVNDITIDNLVDCAEEVFANIEYVCSVVKFETSAVVTVTLDDNDGIIMMLFDGKKGIISNVQVGYTQAS